MSLPLSPTRKDLSVSPLKPALPSYRNAAIAWCRLLGSARGLAISSAAEQHTGPLLVVTRNAEAAEQLEDELRFYARSGQLPVYSFPDWECLPYDVFSPHQGLIAKRLETLYKLPNLARGVVLVAASTALYRLPPRDYVERHSLLLDIGDEIPIERFRQQLSANGYRSVSQVVEPGEFAVRGGLIDLFPVGTPHPFRIELFGDTVESIHAFNPDTQRSGKSLSTIQLLPAREYPLTEQGTQRFRQAFRARFEGDPQKVPLYRDVSKGLSAPGVEFFLPLFFETTSTLFDYLPKNTLLVVEEGATRAASDFTREVQERHQLLRHDLARPLLAPTELFLDSNTFAQTLELWPRVELLDLSPDSTSAADGTIVDFASPAPPELPVDYRADVPHHRLFDYLEKSQGRTLLVTETSGRQETLRALLLDHGLHPVDVGGWTEFLNTPVSLALAVAKLDRGLVLSDASVTVISEPQLYGERVAQRRRRQTNIPPGPRHEGCSKA